VKLPDNSILLQRAQEREIVTPRDYERWFAEGVAAYTAQGAQADNPYLTLSAKTAVESIRAHAWEQGWWSACRADALSRKNSETQVSE
jgi:hypothetical protein